MMSQLELFTEEPSAEPQPSKATHGATWWVGSYQIRNWNGFMQEREQGRGPWCFRIYGFCGEPEEHGEASVYAFAPDGELYHRDVPIDPNNRITVCGRKFSKSHWVH